MRNIKGTMAKSVNLNNIKINDNFLNKYISLVKDVIIPYQWDILNDKAEGVETSHCIENFKIAAGESTGEFYGAVFQDTDVAKWLEAVAYVLAADKDNNLEKIADEVIDLIGRAQGEDGYINTYFTIKEPELRWSNLKEGHELYTAGHLIEAAVAYYESTGKRKFLDIVSKFANLICDTFGYEEGKNHGYPGHQEIELALVKLYHATGNIKYLDTAKYFIDARGVGENYFLKEERSEKYKQIFPEFAGYEPLYSQSHLPVRQQTTAEGHAVRAVYMYCAMADLAYEYKDEELLNSCKALWNNIVEKRMYITGSIGSSGILERFTADYDLPNDINYSETCASIGLALFGLRMAKITKESKYIDIVERALYNTVLSGIALDGKSFFYVNPLEVWPENCLSRTSREHVKAVRQKWFGVACCPPNIARTLASIGQYLYMVDKNNIYINLFAANESKVNLEDSIVKVVMESNFPNENTINIKANGEGEKVYNFFIRIPQYAEHYTVLVNGEEILLNVENGYAKVENLKGENDIKISFDAKARFVYSNAEVRADAYKVALMKGPLVYCLEEKDNGNNLAAVSVDTYVEPVEERSQLFGDITIVELQGKRIIKEKLSNELYTFKRPSVENIKLKAVPYCYWGNRKYGEMTVWIKEC